MFRQATNRSKKVPEPAKLTFANKTKESITFQKLNCRDFWRIAKYFELRYIFYTSSVQRPIGVLSCIW